MIVVNSSASFKNIPRIIPFAMFMGFIGIEEIIRFLTAKGFIDISAHDLALLYPVKVFSVAVALFALRRNYSEFIPRDLLRPLHFVASILTGIIIFVLWIQMDWMVSVSGVNQGFNPTLFNEGTIRELAVTFRVLGAVVVVPIMEELFWRSFLIRYLIDQDINNVPIGMFTWPSFLISAMLFGLEHNMIAAGIMAGICFNLLLYLTRSIALCTLAHAVANLALAVYVLQTGLWYFW